MFTVFRSGGGVGSVDEQGPEDAEGQEHAEGDQGQLHGRGQGRSARSAKPWFPVQGTIEWASVTSFRQ
jgi:hypothetical protein